MSTNITPKHQQKFLKSLLTYLQGFQYQAALNEVAAGPDATYDLLYIVLDIASDQLPGENYLQLEVAFLPQIEDDMEGQSILQMMVPILVADENVDKANLFSLLIKLNTFLPLGSFGYWEEQNMVYHKQNNIVSKNTPAEEYTRFEEQIAMIQYLLTSFVPSLAAVAIDGIDMKQALNDNPFAKAYSGDQ